MKPKTKKNIIKAVSVFVVLLSLLLVSYYLFNLFGGQGKLMNDFQNWAKENLVLACFHFLIISPLVNIIPGISSIFFITLANIMLNDQTVKGMFRAFLLADSSVILTSTILFLLGRLAGKRVVGWIIGKEDYEKAEHLLTIGGKTCLPFVYLLPLFPDDTICFLAGCTDISFTYNFVNVLLFRSAGVFVTCFLGTDFLHYESFTPLQWAAFVLVALILAFAVLILVRTYYRYLRKKEEGNAYLLTRGIRFRKPKSK